MVFDEFEVFIIILDKQDAMGLWPWLFTHPLTKRFWISMKNEGFLMTYTRGHKAVMNSHSVGGNSERTKFMGQDHYGNKYYEDFDAVHPNQRRWVEYNDYFSVRSPNGDKIPPMYHGWLSCQYDDFPQPDGDSFHQPFFERPHDWNPSDSGFKRYTSRQDCNNDKALDYSNYRLGRYAKPWEPSTKRQ